MDGNSAVALLLQYKNDWTKLKPDQMQNDIPIAIRVVSADQQLLMQLKAAEPPPQQLAPDDHNDLVAVASNAANAQRQQRVCDLVARILAEPWKDCALQRYYTSLHNAGIAQDRPLSEVELDDNVQTVAFNRAGIGQLLQRREQAKCFDWGVLCGGRIVFIDPAGKI
jgi:hypothetical protein